MTQGRAIREGQVPPWPTRRTPARSEVKPLRPELGLNVVPARVRLHLCLSSKVPTTTNVKVPTFQFCVDEVLDANLVLFYDPAQNVETCDTF